MKKNPLVSAIITTKNEEKNIERLLKSIKAQTYDNLETIIVDNNSKDKTKEIVINFAKKEYKKSPQRLGLFNKGPERSAQRNYGVSKARGVYALILDADMELTPKVIESLVSVAIKSDCKALIVPEKTVGKGFMASIRKFERMMYVGDATIEVARFFDKKVFEKYGGYDEKLTGAEDYDLPKRISKEYKIGWGKEWLYHHEEQLTLPKQLKKKYYYASKSALYAKKHPGLVATQGNMLFRKAYFRNWRKFVNNPFIGLAFVFVRLLETTSAVFGYISAVGLKEFVKTFFSVFKYSK